MTGDDGRRSWVRRIVVGTRREGWWFVWTRGTVMRLRSWRHARRSGPHPFGAIEPGELVGGDDLVLRRLVAPEVAVTLPPVRAHRRIDGNPTWATHRRVPARELLVVRNGRVFGGTGWLGARGAVLERLGNSHHLPEWYERERLAGLHPGRHLPGRTVSLTQSTMLNYFHWLMQGVPRLATVLGQLGGASSIDHFVHSEPVAPHLAETLERLGVPLDRLVRIDGHEIVTCDELAAATMVRDDDVIPPDHIELVRDLFAAELAPAADEILYVSRARTATRRVVNDDEVRAAITRAGGRTVESLGMSVAEQAAVFSKAAVLVGVHGADLTNEVWMPPTGRLLEILPANLAAAPFATLCRSRGMAYDFTVGVEAALPRRMHVGLNRGDVRVDVADLERRLAALLASG